MKESKILVYYDRDCSLCVQLAGFGQKKWNRILQFEPFQEAFPDQVPRDLAVSLSDGSHLEGAEAWQLLLQEIPELSSLNWIASKLGLSGKSGALLNLSGKVARKICFRCGRGIKNLRK